MELKTVNVPPPFKEGFLEAEKKVKNFFSGFKMNPEKGSIEIDGERYLLVRAESLSVQFYQFIKNMYPSLNEEESIEATSKILFDMAHIIGRSDAKVMHKKMNLKDPIAKLSAGPVHFAFTGWAFVDILPESHPSPDVNYMIIYDHPQSFEADSWAAHGKKTNFCTCFMNSGYSSGWCEESFQIPLVAREILCRSKGDKICRFIMSQPHRLEEFCHKYISEHPELFQKA